MDIIDFIEVWATTIKDIVESAGVTLQFQRSAVETINPACNINASYKEREVDILIWASGEAEMAIGESGRVIMNIHSADIRNKEELSQALSHVMQLALRT